MKIRTKQSPLQKVSSVIKKKKIVVGIMSAFIVALFFGIFFFLATKQEEETQQAMTKLQQAVNQTLTVAKTVESSTVTTSTEETEKQELVPSVEPEAALNDRPGIEEINQAQLDVEKMADSIVGYLSIPDLQLEVPILEGTTYEKMLYGATTVLAGQTMGRGNYVLAAHNMGVPGLMFSSLAEIKAGAQLIMKDRNDQSFTYHVDKVFVVQAHETEILKLSKKAILTLITCDRATATTGRVVVQGSLVN